MVTQDIIKTIEKLSTEEVEKLEACVMDETYWNVFREREGERAILKRIVALYTETVSSSGQRDQRIILF